MRVLGKRRAEEGWCEGEAFLRFSGESATAALSLAWRGIQEVFHKPDSWLQ